MTEFVRSAPFSCALALLLLAIFAFQWATPAPSYDYVTGSGRIPVLMLTYGVVSSAVREGEWWRLVTAGFLHASLIHIALNLWGLLYAAPFVERWYGPLRFAVIFLAAVLVGDVAAALTSDTRTVTLGASGGIVGLFGAVIVVGLRFWSQRDEMVRGAIPLIATLMNGLVHPSISNAGHVGGAIGGLALSWWLGVEPAARDAALDLELRAIRNSRDFERRLARPPAGAIRDHANTIVLQPNKAQRIRIAGLAALCFVLAAACFLAASNRSDALGWAGVVLFSAAGLVMVYQLFFARLELTPEGFTVRGIVTQSMEWRDLIPNFAPGTMSGSPAVFYRVRPEIEAARRGLRVLTGGTRNVPAIYGLSAEKQARLMAETYRKWVLAGDAESREDQREAPE